MAKVTVHEAEMMARDNLRSLKAEYTRLRDIAQKRIQRMGKSKFAESKAYLSHTFKTVERNKIGIDEKGNPIYEYKEVTRHGFQELKNIDIRDLPTAFSELSKFVSAKGSTVTGQRQIREKTINTLQKQGLGVNENNYNKVIKIFEEMRKQKLTYGSDKVVELADAMLYLDDQQTNEWLDHIDTLLQNTDKLQEVPIDEGYDIDEILDMLGE